jgi:hypothetical protein
VHVLLFSAGELTEEQIETVKTIIANPLQFNIPTWFLNRQKDVKTGKTFQLTANQVDTKLREDMERMKKVRCVLTTSSPNYLLFSTHHHVPQHHFPSNQIDHFSDIPSASMPWIP